MAFRTHFSFKKNKTLKKYGNISKWTNIVRLVIKTLLRNKLCVQKKGERDLLKTLFCIIKTYTAAKSVHQK